MNSIQGSYTFFGQFKVIIKTSTNLTPYELF